MLTGVLEIGAQETGAPETRVEITEAVKVGGGVEELEGY